MPPALLSYAVTPTTVPTTTDPTNPSTVTLMIVVANGTGRQQLCSEIDFLVPASLTTNPSSIAPAAAIGTNWSIQSDGNGRLTATPRVALAPINPGDSLAFLIEGAQVAQAVGLAEIVAYEVTDIVRQTMIGVLTAPPGLAVTSFVANPIQVQAGQQTTLSWTTTGATTCRLSWAGASISVPVSGSEPVSPLVTTTYTLTAAGAGTAVAQQVTVVVPTVQILHFAATPNPVTAGDQSTLSWRVINAAACYLEPGRRAIDPSQGATDVTVMASAQYTLEAYGYGADTASQTFWVDAGEVTIESFTATPAIISPLATAPVTLAWATAYAASCAIAPNVGAVPTTGAVSVPALPVAAYTLTATALTTRNQSVRVAVSPAITHLQFTTDPATPNQVVVTWQASGDSATFNRAPAPVSGTQTVTLQPKAPVTAALVVSGSGATLIAALILGSASSQTPTCRIESVTLSCPDGLNTPGASVSVSWQAVGAGGTITCASSTGARTSGTGLTGTLDFAPGLAFTSWHGYLSVGRAETRTMASWAFFGPNPAAGDGDV